MAANIIILVLGLNFLIFGVALAMFKKSKDVVDPLPKPGRNVTSRKITHAKESLERRCNAIYEGIWPEKHRRVKLENDKANRYLDARDCIEDLEVVITSAYLPNYVCQILVGSLALVCFCINIILEIQNGELLPDEISEHSYLDLDEVQPTIGTYDNEYDATETASVQEDTLVSEPGSEVSYATTSEASAVEATNKKPTLIGGKRPRKRSRTFSEFANEAMTTRPSKAEADEYEWVTVDGASETGMLDNDDDYEYTYVEE